MANAISDEIHSNVKDLISSITHFEENSDKFKNLQKCVLTTLKKSDTMYFLNTKDIKKAVWSMAEKFQFHGFFKHAEYLKQLHDKYIDKNLSESDLTPRLNITKFLLCLSESPTTHFWKSPEKFIFITEKATESDVIDWGAYLTEGIERWSPTNEDSLQEHSDTDDEVDSSKSPTKGVPSSSTLIPEAPSLEIYDFRACKSKLLDTIQTNWYNGGVVCMKPPSDWFDAKVGLLWEEHLQNQARNLIDIEPVTIISEYKVMREVLWQMWGPHNSTVFQFNVNNLVAKPNVTISSVCSMTFEHFLDVFVPYIEVLDEFRQFYSSLDGDVCETYKSYGMSLQRIMKSVFRDLVEIEKEVWEQENTMTLLKLATRLETVFKPIHILKTVHQEVVLENFQNCTPLQCSLTLLTCLRRSLDYSLNKMEQDILLTLYLESLYYYLTMTNAWLVKNDLYDHTSEFIIINKNEKSSEVDTPEMNFLLQENIKEFVDQDAIIKTIADQVLQIGRNIHLLRLLGKYDVFARCTETIHQEFVRRILEEIASYYGRTLPETVRNENPQIQKVVSSFDMNQMGDWTSFVDLSDGFLAKAFEDFRFETIENDSPEPTLYEKISQTTDNLFPLQNLPEKIFCQILKDRFTISGLMVKNLLIENYNLDKQFDFLNHIFLFWDDLIFPFYRRLFEKMNTANSNWGNSVWLTSHLQDVVADLYPTFSENCTVQVKDYWKQCRDSVEACSLINVQYEIQWPLNIIITGEHIVKYKELFQFILKIKWALYTVNHLFFTDLEPKNKSMKAKASLKTLKRLKNLRFNLINILNNIQHYIFGFILTKHRLQFELDFEKANDLKSLTSAHENFIQETFNGVIKVRDKNSGIHGFYTLLKCVKMLKVMWNQPSYATAENLENCRKIYKASFEVVNPIVNPVFVLEH